MLVFVFDSSFEGLLTAIYESYYQKHPYFRIETQEEHITSFLEDELFIDTDSQKAQRVSTAIRSKISDAALDYAYTASLSELPGISNEISLYIRKGFSIGASINSYLTDPSVMAVHKASSKVTFETHRLTGLVRFKRLKSSIYYSSIEPDGNVLTMLAPHFAERLKDQKWVIHDLKRNLAVIYDTKKWVVETIHPQQRELANPTGLSDVDSDYEQLWKLYFKHISIESRRNLKLQKQFMPARYWLHLTEKRF